MSEIAGYVTPEQRTAQGAALYQQAVVYYQGQGVTRDVSKAIQLFVAAAQVFFVLAAPRTHASTRARTHTHIHIHTHTHTHNHTYMYIYIYVYMYLYILCFLLHNLYTCRLCACVSYAFKDVSAAGAILSCIFAHVLTCALGAQREPR